MLTSSISLVSIGFSTWSICDRADADINIAADDTVGASDYIYILESSIICFDYNEKGVIDSNTDMVGMNGDIIVPIEISKVNLLYKKLGSLSTRNELPLSISFRYYDLKDTSANFLQYISSFEIGEKRNTSPYVYSSVSVDSSSGSAVSRYVISGTENTDTSYLLRLVYHFSFSAADYKTIYSHLNNGDMHISLSIAFGE